MPDVPADRQDGVSLPSKITSTRVAAASQRQDNFALAPGNRVDILVRAPSATGNSVLAFGQTPPPRQRRSTIVVHVVVEAGNSVYNTSARKKRRVSNEAPVS